VLESFQIFSERFGVSSNRIVVLFLIIFLTLLARKVSNYMFGHKLIHIANKTKTEFDDLLLKALKDPVGYFILLGGSYLAFHSLGLPEKIGGFNMDSLIEAIFTLLFTFVILLLVFRLLDILSYYIYKAAQKTDTRLDEQLAPLVIKSLKIVAAILAVLAVLDNLGWNIKSLLAGVGIGGLAFALAAQDTVSNIFGSFTVLSDRAFKIGDWIKVGDMEGTVEDVGVRSTRIRRFDQALVTMPNSTFIKTAIINFSEMKKRRIKLTIGVTYNTTREQLVKAVEGIRKIIEEDDRFDHSFYMVRFTDFGESSLNIFVYCFTRTTVWPEYLKVREEFLLKIMELFEKLDIEIAYPTRKIYLENE